MTKAFLCLCLLTVFTKLSAQQNSYLQVKAEPNISVFLNDEFQGKTTVEFSGLIIEKLKAGSYSIKVVKEGFTPQSETIVLKPGEVKIYQVKPFVPQYKISQSGNKQQQTIELKTGGLKVQSIPVEIQIEITDLSIKSSKTDDEWNIENIPTGLHELRFTWNTKVLNWTVNIEQGTIRHLFADFINGRIEIRDSIISTSASSEEKRREAETDRMNDILNKTKNALANSKNSGAITDGFNETSYNLQGRAIINLPSPKYESQGEGRVVVEISVDREGKVIQAVPGVKGSTTLNDNLLKAAKDAALRARFEVQSDAPSIQKGTISYSFMMK
jgi:hypothetical protein